MYRHVHVVLSRTRNHSVYSHFLNTFTQIMDASVGVREGGGKAGRQGGRREGRQTGREAGRQKRYVRDIQSLGLFFTLHPLANC